jgi:hypothetical protein
MDKNNAAAIPPLTAPAPLTDPLSEYQPGQWWLKELESLSVLAEPTADQVRAAKVACNFADAIFSNRPDAAKLAAAIQWVNTAQHGDNCFVSDHYDGDPGNRCNCGKDSLLAYLESDGAAPAPLTDEKNALQDALLYGTGITQGGKHVPYQEFTAAPAPQQSESIHCQEFHELAMAYRSAPAFRANEPYFELVAYINNKFAKAALATVQTDRMPPIQSIHYIDGQGTRVELQILHGGPSAHGFEITVAAPVQAEQVAAVRAALKPFADLAELFDAENRGSNMPGADADPVMQWPRLHKDYVLTVGHLRAARNALAAPSTATSNDTGALGDTGGAE